MKMRFMKRSRKAFVCAGLVLSMLLGLTACGKEKTGSQSADTNAALAKEYVYAEHPLDMDSLGTDIGFRQLALMEDRVYLVYESYNWESASNGQNNITKLLSMDKDGSNMQEAELQMYPGGVAPDRNETSGDGADGASSPASGARTAVTLPMEPIVGDTETEEGESEDAAVEEPAPGGYVYEYLGLGQLVFGSDNKLYGMKNYYYEDYRNPDKPIYLNENYICCWDLEGTMLWENVMEPLQTEDSWSYVQSMIAMPDGGVGLLISGDKSELMAVSAEGVQGARKPLSASAETLNYSMQVFSGEAGKITYTYWDQETGNKIWMNTYDVVNDTVGEPYQLPDSFLTQGYSGMADGGDVADIIYTTAMGVFAFDMGDTEPRQLMSFINSDIATNNMNYVLMLDENSMIGFYYDDVEQINKGSLFTKVNPEDVVDKKVLVLAANYAYYELKNRVVQFNKTNPEYRIVIKDYSTYNTVDDYMASYTQLNNDILANGMPDILVADYNMPLQSYINKGLLADIDQLIAEDEELAGKEFMQNVFDAYRVGGKLYYVIPSFNVRTMIGKSSVVGDRTSWNMQELQDLAASLPEGTTMFGDMIRSSFMYNMMQYCGNDFIDVETGKCNFNSENFIKMLEYAKSLPEEMGEDYYGEDYWMTYESQYREDRTVLMHCYISEAREMNRYINGYFGEDISYIGFPTDGESGSVLMANDQYAISAKSKNQEGAWEFVRFYLTEENQRSLSYQLPVDKALFLEKAEELMSNPYYVNQMGEKEEYEDTFYMNGESFPLPNMTREQVDEFVSFVEGVNKSIYVNDDITNIINEEAESFFSGQKSAADVAAIIQSRAQVYVNENS